MSRKIKWAYFHTASGSHDNNNESLIKLESNKAGPKPKDKDLSLLCEVLEKSKAVINKKGPKNISQHIYAADQV